MTSRAARLVDFFTQRPRRELAAALEHDEPLDVRALRQRGDAFLAEAERLRLLAEPLPEGTPARARPVLEAQTVRCYAEALGGGQSWDDLPEATRRSVLAAPDEPWLRSILAGAVPTDDHERLGRVARRLRALLHPWEHERRQARRAILARAVASLVLLALLLVGAGQLARLARGSDLALGKRWRTSSAQAGSADSGVVSRNVTDYFFHTHEEENPWVQVDLGAPTRVGSVLVENRRDCCFARAAPLVVEVSDDGQKFREVARHTSEFRSTTIGFAPTTARYVRLRVPRRSFFHLASLGVFKR